MAKRIPISSSNSNMRLTPYLLFHGNCRAAMHFYQQCIGGTLRLQTIGESPLSEQMPPAIKDMVLHASLVAGPLTLLGTDMVGRDGLVHGTAVQLMLDCDSEVEVRQHFAALSEGGKVDHPLEFAFFGAFIGNLIDRYGQRWMLHHQPPHTHDTPTT
jgi:PhnB protein